MRLYISVIKTTMTLYHTINNIIGERTFYFLTPKVHHQQATNLLPYLDKLVCKPSHFPGLCTQTTQHHKTGTSQSMVNLILVLNPN